MKKLSQKEIILNHLKKYGSITIWESIAKYRITRLSDRIYTLRNENYDIQGIWIHQKDGRQNYIKYILKEGN